MLYIVAIVLAIALSLILGREKGLRLIDLYVATIAILICALLGGKLYAVYREVAQADSWPPWNVLWNSGTGSSGVYVGGFIAALLILPRMRLPLLTVLDLYAPSIAMGLVIARLGCFMAGCCYGSVCNLPWCLSFPAGSPAFSAQLNAGFILPARLGSLPVHPTQLYEVGFGVAAFVALLRWRKRIAVPGVLFFAFFASYGLFRVFIETLRGDFRPPLGNLLGLSLPQAVFGSIAVCSLAALVHIIVRGRP